MARIKKVSKSRMASSKDIQDHILGETTATVHNSTLDGTESSVHYNVKEGEVHSDIHLEDDEGFGKTIVVRSFDFKANPAAFHAHTPSKQEIFNAHAKQIEAYLWEDGLQPMPDVNIQVILSKKREGYRIVVGAEPRKGQIISRRDQDKIQTLSQAAHGRFST
jgi:hypothetical protein